MYHGRLVEQGHFIKRRGAMLNAIILVSDYPLKNSGGFRPALLNSFEVDHRKPLVFYSQRCTRPETNFFLHVSHNVQVTYL